MTNQKNEHLIEAASVNVENAREFMQASLESIEKVAKLQLDASKKMLAETSEAIKEISSANNPKDFFERVNQLATHSVETNISNCRDLYEVMQEVQSKVTKMIEANIQTSKQNMANAVGGFANLNQANPISDPVKNWVNSVNQAVSNMTKMAAQFSEFANKNVKATTEATTTATAAAEKKTAAKK